MRRGLRGGRGRSDRSDRGQRGQRGQRGRHRGGAPNTHHIGSCTEDAAAGPLTLKNHLSGQQAWDVRICEDT